MRFVTVTAEELGHLREGLQIIESLNEYDNRVEIYFYGLTDNPTLLETVKAAVSDEVDGEIDQADVNVTEAVFVFPLSADILYYLTGSGLTVREGDAIYSSGGGEGPRSVNLEGVGRHGSTQATAGEFKTMALSRDEFSGDDFLMQYGNKAQQAQPQAVERTEPAQEQAQKPVEAPAAEAAPTPNPTGIPPAKRSSLRFSVDQWLG
jgi:hypothetical protein